MSRILGLAAVLIVLLATPAAAQSPTVDAYGGAGGLLGEVTGPPQGGGTAGEGSDGGAPPVGEVAGTDAFQGDSTVKGPGSSGAAPGSSGAAPGSSGTAPTSKPLATTGQLPFTGLDVGFLAAGSLLLVAMGFALRQLGRRPT